MANTRKDRRVDPALIEALEAQLAAAYDAKGFLGAQILTATCQALAMEFYADFLECDMSPGSLMLAATRTRALNEIYSRIVAAAQAGDAAQAELARVAE